jgi:predicted ATPase/class 3 adenylate cyclase
MPSVDLPTGTVSFLFTDIEGSTRLLEQDPALLQSAMQRHHALVTAAIEKHHGFVFETVGDAFYAAFLHAVDAVAAAVDAQIALTDEPWDPRAPIKARMAIHTGDVERQGNKYFGASLFRTARLLSTAHGGQTVVSSSTAALVQDALSESTQLQDLGEHRLRDLTRPERIWQLLHPALAARFPPLRSLSILPNNLPTQMTSFVGRDREIHEARRLMSTARLVTFIGTGGAGKTRLATQLGADMLIDFEHGVWFIDLAPLTGSDQVAMAIAASLNMTIPANQPQLATIVAQLSPKHLLLILDNCEHLIDACASAADSLLRGCPQMQILATSREVLGVPGEVSWRIPSLPTPDPRRSLSIEQVSQYAAVRLFIERATAMAPTFAVTNQNAPAVAQICWRLDGIPLAIELAASRVRVLSAEQIAARLDDSFRLLTGGSRTLLPRQQTLRALVDWSHDLLTEREKIVFRRLAAFTGGFGVEAAEVVCSAHGDVDPFDVLDLLTQLVEKSLVLADDHGEEIRYRLLESMRQYAMEKLVASGELATVRERHAAYFVERMEAAEPLVATRERAAVVRRIAADYDNVRAILSASRAALSTGAPRAREVECGLRLVGVLFRYWVVRGAIAEGHAWIDHLLKGQPRHPSVGLVRALNSAGFLTGLSGQPDQARSWLNEAIDVGQAIGDKSEFARALVLHSAFADPSNGAAQHEDWLERGTAIFREIGDVTKLAMTVHEAGVLALHNGDRRLARARLALELAYLREVDNTWGLTQCLNGLGDLARTEGDLVNATSLYVEALQLSREQRLSGMIPSLLHNLGHVARSDRDLDGASSYFKEAIALFRDREDARGVAECLGGLAITLTSASQLTEAAQLFGAAEALLLATGVTMWTGNRADFDAGCSEVKLRLGDVDYEKAWAIGEAMSMEQAIVFALNVEVATSNPAPAQVPGSAIRHDDLG